ncbi:MAG: flagellar basal body protein FliL [Rhodospirillaceae bacterium]|jgi:flagellar protein FliL|nr:flagellar basal body protein FliL [Rhodospirillaceae bacterium]
MTDQTADDGIEAVVEGDGAGKGGSKKKALFVAGAILAFVLVGAGAYLGGAMDMLAGGDAPAEAEVHQPLFYDLPDMLVNLNGSGRKLSFLKLNVSLELAKPEDELVMKAMLPRIVDNFQVYLRELRVEDLQGSEGIYRLREELLRRVNMAVHPAQVSDVLFKEMLVQ